MGLNEIKRKPIKVLDSRVPCMRCKGRKKMFKFGSGYSIMNNGGKQVDCPMCLGAGKIKPLSEFQEQLLEIKNKSIEQTESVSKSIGSSNAKKESRARKA